MREGPAGSEKQNKPLLPTCQADASRGHVGTASTTLSCVCSASVLESGRNSSSTALLLHFAAITIRTMPPLTPVARH